MACRDSTQLTVKQLATTLQDLGHKPLQAAIDKITQDTNKEVAQHRDNTWLPNFDRNQMPKLMNRLYLDETMPQLLQHLCPNLMSSLIVIVFVCLCHVQISVMLFALLTIMPIMIGLTNYG